MVPLLLALLVLGPRATGGIGSEQQTKLDEADINQWLDRISEDLGSVRGKLGAGILEKTFKTNGVVTSPVDEQKAKDLLVKVQSRIQNFLWKSENSVKNIRIQAELSYSSYTPQNYSCDTFKTYPYLRAAAIVKKEPPAPTQSPTPGNFTRSNWSATALPSAAMTVESSADFCSKEAPLELTPDPRLYDVETNRANSTSHVPPNIYDASNEILNVANWTNHLDKVFISNAKSDTTLKWQYFGTTEGMFKIYPGIQWFVQTKNYTQKDSPIDFFDCRTQYWYLLAATYPKDMVVLIDNSGSMKGSGSIMANKTLIELLYTVSVNDFFNVIMFMNMSVKYMSDDFNRTMLQATEMNKHKIMDLIRQDEEKPHNQRQFAPQGVSDFSVALVEAFELLRLAKNGSAPSSGGVQIIMLVSDSAPDEFVEIFKKYNPDRQVRLFTFLIGQEATDENIVRAMACRNRGFFVQISTLADVKENVQRYMPVMARTNALMRDYFFVWTGVHQNQIKTQNPTALTAHVPAAPTVRPTTLPPTMEQAGAGFTLFPTSANTGEAAADAVATTSPVPGLNTNASSAMPTLAPTTQPLGVPGRSVGVVRSTARIKGDTSQHQIKEEDPRVKNKLFASVAQAAYDTRVNETQNNGYGQLIGVAGLDVPVDQFERLGSAWELGVLSYIFMVTNNGFILFHPEFRPIDSTGNVQMFYNNKDIAEIEFPAESGLNYTAPSYDLPLRVSLIRRKNGFVDMARIKTYDDMRRGFRQQFRYFYAPLNSTSPSGQETRPTPFSLGLALPWNPLKNIRWPPTVGYDNLPRTHSLTILELTSGFSEGLANSTCDPNAGAYRAGLADYEFCEFPGEILAQYNVNQLCAAASVLRMNQTEQAAIKCSTEYLARLVTDAASSKAVQDTWSKLKSETVDKLDRLGVGLLFLWTSSGLARWHFGKSDPIDPTYAMSRRNGSRDSLYEKTVLLASSDPEITAVLTGPSSETAAVNMKSNLSVPVQLTFTLHAGSPDDAVFGVMGAELNYDRLAEYFAGATKSCVGDRGECRSCADTNVRCYLLDGGGSVVVSENREDVGKSFDQVNCAALKLMVEQGIFVTMDYYDFQTVCSRKVETHTGGGSASTIFSPIRSLIRFVSWALIEGSLILADLTAPFFQTIRAQAQDAVAGRTPLPQPPQATSMPPATSATPRVMSQEECRRNDASQPEGVRQMKEGVDAKVADVAAAVTKLNTPAEKTDAIKLRLIEPYCVARRADDEIAEAACAHLCQRLKDQFGMGLVTELLGSCPQRTETAVACVIWRTLLRRSETPLPKSGFLGMQCLGLGLCEACAATNGSFEIYVRQVKKTNLIFVAVAGDPNCDCSGCIPIVGSKDLTTVTPFNLTLFQPHREKPPWTRPNIVLTDNATVCSSRGTPTVKPGHYWLATAFLAISSYRLLA